MTDEELLKEIQTVSEGIESLPKSDKELTKEDRRRKYVLLSKKEALDKIRAAREKNDKSQELYQSMVYGLLTSWGEKHPYLAGLARANIRWNMF